MDKPKTKPVMEIKMLEENVGIEIVAEPEKIM